MRNTNKTSDKFFRVFKNLKNNIMKTLIKFTITIVFIFLTSGKCSDDKKESIEKKSIVLVLGIDNSATMSGFPVWTKQHLETVCNAMYARNTFVSVCVKKIGNPNNNGFKRLQLQKIPIIENATLSVRAKQRREAELTKTQDLELIKQFLTSISLERNNDKRTCLNRFCQEANILFNEPQFQSFQKLLCIYSDGYEDSNGDDVPEPINAKFSSDVSICIIGWKNTNKLSHSGVINEFTDIQGFLSHINSSTF